jgi:hypothetical protein
MWCGEARAYGLFRPQRLPLDCVGLPPFQSLLLLLQCTADDVYEPLLFSWKCCRSERRTILVATTPTHTHTTNDPPTHWLFTFHRKKPMIYLVYCFAWFLKCLSLRLRISSCELAVWSVRLLSRLSSPVPLDDIPNGVTCKSNKNIPNYFYLLWLKIKSICNLFLYGFAVYETRERSFGSTLAKSAVPPDSVTRFRFSSQWVLAHNHLFILYI